MQNLLHWTPELQKRFTRDNLLFEHDLHTSELFSDEALISLIDRFPREGVEVFTMGYDPTNWNQWYFGRRKNTDGSDLDGRQLMEGVRAGRLWLNLRKVNHHDPSVGALCERMFEEISAKTGISTLKPDLGLLISSKAKRRTSRREVSEMAIVPLSECNTPTLTVSAASACRPV